MKPTTLQDRILQHFSELGLGPRDELPTELELVEALEVSRPALREALAVLEAFGVIVSRQGARRTLGSFDMGVVVDKLTHVMEPTTDVLLELLDVRRVLEVAFFPIAVANMSDEQVGQLQKVTDRMHARAREGRTFIQEDAEFHRAIYAHLGNKTLGGLLAAFWQMFEQMSNETTTGQDLEESARSHSRIVDALKADDVTLAVHQLNVHFFDVRARLTGQRKSAGPRPASNKS